MKFKTIFYTLLFLFVTTSLFGAQVKLSWNPNSESDLAGYKVYWGTASGSYSKSVDVDNETSYTTITGLSHEVEYFFAVTAYDLTGNESGYSNEVSWLVPADTTPPDDPTGAGLSERVANLLIWKHDQKGIDGHYRVYVKSNLRAETYIRITTDKFIYISGVNKEKQRLAVSWVINEPVAESGISNIVCVKFKGRKAWRMAC